MIGSDVVIMGEEWQDKLWKTLSAILPTFTHEQWKKIKILLGSDLFVCLFVSALSVLKQMTHSNQVIQ